MSLSMPIHCLSRLREFRPYLESHGVYTLGDALRLRDTCKNTQLQRVLDEFSGESKPWSQRVTKADSCSGGILLRTYTSSLDRSLGGGIPPCSLVEVFGPAGVGKTQFALQLCCTVQIPTHLGGLGGKVLYLSSEGPNFPTGRLEEIASATVDSWAKRGYTPTHSLLDGVYVQKIGSLNDLLGRLENYVSEKWDALLKDVRLLVLDSIAFPFRFTEEASDEPSFKSTSKLFKIFCLLNRFALYRKAVVLVTNQMTAVLDGYEGERSSALGTNWSHSGSTKVFLDFHPRGRAIRSLSVKKCTYKDIQNRDTCYYAITKDGIRDVSEDLIQKTLHASQGN